MKSLRDIPVELITHILSYVVDVHLLFDFRTQMNSITYYHTILVCKEWYDILNTSTLIKDLRNYYSIQRRLRYETFNIGMRTIKKYLDDARDILNQLECITASDIHYDLCNENNVVVEYKCMGSDMRLRYIYHQKRIGI